MTGNSEFKAFVKIFNLSCILWHAHLTNAWKKWANQWNTGCGLVCKKIRQMNKDDWQWYNMYVIRCTAGVSGQGLANHSLELNNGTIWLVERCTTDLLSWLLTNQSLVLNNEAIWFVEHCTADMLSWYLANQSSVPNDEALWLDEHYTTDLLSR